jgi:hypothetical protein
MCNHLEGWVLQYTISGEGDRNTRVWYNFKVQFPGIFGVKFVDLVVYGGCSMSPKSCPNLLRNMCHLRQGCIPYLVKEAEMAEACTTFMRDFLVFLGSNLLIFWSTVIDPFDDHVLLSLRQRKLKCVREKGAIFGKEQSSILFPGQQQTFSYELSWYVLY